MLSSSACSFPWPKRGLPGLLDVVRASGGMINLSQRKLARQIGVSRRTLQRAFNDLVDAGAVVLDTSKVGTTVALAY
jgi:predicted DNA-binding transcriptional regulator YafY